MFINTYIFMYLYVYKYFMSNVCDSNQSCSAFMSINDKL